jgi:basic membrane protein A
MRKIKIALAVLLVLALTFTVFACKGGGDDDKKGLHVGILTTSGVDDGSFGQACYEGIQAFVKANPGTSVNDVKEDKFDRVVQAVAEIIADYDAMVMPGFQFAGAGKVADENPEKFFLLVDAYPKITDDGEEVQLDNVYAMMFKEEESGFFAGIAAAMHTKTNKVAVVNGIAFPSNVNYQWGFMSGVNYANKHYGTKAEVVELPAYAGTDVTGANVGGNYIGAFADQATGKIVGEALLAQGVDIMLVAAGDSGNGVFAAVKEAPEGNFVIGCDVDQYDDGETGTRNIVLTSALKNMAPIVQAQLQKINDGTFKGENALLGAKEGGTGYVSAAGRHQLSEDALAKLAEVYELVKNGTIVPAANFNGHTPDNFPGL